MNIKFALKAALVLGLIAYGASLRAHAAPVNATCQGKEIHSEGGVVWVNGKKAKVVVNTGDYVEAQKGGITYSLAHTDAPDAPDIVSWTGKGKKHGVCTVAAQYSPK